MRVVSRAHAASTARMPVVGGPAMGAAVGAGMSASGPSLSGRPAERTLRTAAAAEAGGKGTDEGNTALLDPP